MDPLVQVVTAQRNAALDALAQAHARSMQLEASIKELEAQVAALRGQQASSEAA